MLKKNFVCKLTICLILAIISVFPILVLGAASSGSVTDTITWSFDSDTGIMLLKGNGSMPDYVSYSDVPWNDIRDDILRVEIGEGITSVGKSAFYAMPSLASVQLSDTVTSIGASAFGNCEALGGVYIPENVEKIGLAAFAGCTHMSAITVSEANPCYESVDNVLYTEDMTHLAVYPAGRTSNVFSLPQTVTAIDGFAFFRSTYLTKLYTTLSLTQIGDYAFAYAPNLAEIHYPGTMGMWEYISLGEGVYEEAGSNAPDGGCYLTVDNMIEASYSGDCGDSLNWSLDTTSGKLVINGSGEMYDYTDNAPPWIRYYDYITSVEIGKDVTHLSPRTFKKCLYLEDISVQEGNTAYTITDGVLMNKDETRLIAYPACREGASYVIPQTVEVIEDYAFYGCWELTRVEIPLYIYEIGDYAFANTPVLDEIVYEGPELMWGGIDFGTDALIDVGYDTADGHAIIYYGTKVEPIYSGSCGDSLTWTLDTTAKKLTISGTGEMYSYKDSKAPWWRYRGYVSSVYIENGVTSIGEYAFNSCTSLLSVSFADGSSLTDIREGAFYGCVYLSIINLPGKVTSIDSHAFAYCVRLSAFVIPTNVTTIGDYAFFECQSLQSLVVYDALTSIGQRAMANCYNLKYITFQGSQIQWLGISKGSEWDYNAGKDTDIGKYTLATSGGPDLDTETTGPCGDNLVWNFDYTTGKLVISGTGKMDDCRVYNPPWYKWEDYITSVEILPGVTSIGKYAFYSIDSLKSVKLADTITEIGTYAFAFCDNLTEIDFPDSLLSIGTFAFMSCDSLRSIEFSNNLTTISDEAFYGCRSLTEVNLPASLTSIGGRVFTDNTSLVSINVSADNPSFCSVDGVLFNKSKTTLYSYPAGKSETQYTVPDGVTALYYGAFDSNTTLKNIVLPESMKHIMAYAFNSTVATINIPDGVKSLGDYAFYAAKGLKNVVLPNGLETIGYYTFDYCDNLESIQLSNSLKSIGNCAIARCPNLKTIYYAGTPYKWNTVKKGTDWDKDSGTSASNGTYSFVYLNNADFSGKYGDNITWELWMDEGLFRLSGQGAMATEGTIPWSGYRQYIKKAEVMEGVTSVDNGAFWGASNLTKVTLADSVTSLGYRAFSGCTSLADITIPDGVTAIGDYAFSGCSLLNAISTSSCKEIGNYSFEDCTKLSSVSLPACTQTGNYSFSGCTSLSGISLPSCKTIGAYAFEGCTSLETLSIPSCVTVGIYAFKGCKALTGAINIPLCEVIGKYAFSGCIGIESVNAPLCRSIGDYTFNGCTRLKTITLGDDFSYIGSYAFQDCSQLRSINLPSGITAISDGVFSGCTSLSGVVIPSAVTYIGEKAFMNCTTLVSINIPRTVTGIGASAFSGCTKIKNIYYESHIINWLLIDKGSSWDRYVGGTSVTVDNYTLHFGEDTPTSGTFADTLTWTYSESDNSLKITGNGPMTDWEDDKSVPWYVYMDEIKTVVIEEGVTTVGDYAFSQSSSIKNVTLSNTVESIGYRAFYWSNNIKGITMSSGLKAIESYAFENCSGLEEISFPNTLTSIGEGAFQNCSSLTNVTLPQGLSAIMYYTFRNCYALTSVSIPETVVLIEGHVFENCTKLADIWYGGGKMSWESVDKDLAWDVTAGKDTENGTYTMHYLKGDYVGTCGKEVFWELWSDDGVLKIYGNGAMFDWTVKFTPWMKHNSKIKTVEIADGVTSIGSYAFYGLSMLSSVYLPETLTYIGEYAFQNCYELEHIYFDGGSIAWENMKKTTGWDTDAGSKTEKGVYELHIDEYVSGTCGEDLAWTYYKDEKGLYIWGSGDMDNWDSENRPGWYAYRNKVTYVSIPTELSSVGSYAFDGFTALTEISLPEELAKIGAYAFADCVQLSEINYDTKLSIWNTIPKGDNWDKNAGANTAKGTYTLNTEEEKVYTGMFGTNITWEFYDAQNRLVLKGTGAMSNEYGTNNVPWIKHRELIKTVEISEGITTIGAYAFYECTALESITLNEGITGIGASAFSSCSSLKTVYLPKSLTSIGNKVFYGCSSLENIYFAGHRLNWNAVTKGTDWDYNAGSDTQSGKYALHYGEEVSYTGSCGAKVTWTYWEDRRLLEIEGTGAMTEGTTGSWAPWYSYRDKIDTIDIKDGVTTIGKYAFNECKAKSATIPKSVTAIGQRAFEDCVYLADIYYAGSEIKWTGIEKGSSWDYNLGWNTSNKKCTIHFAEENETSGSCGVSLIWEYSEEEKTLTISGSGPMYNWNSNTVVPWNIYSKSIQTVEITGDVTSIGDYAFYECENLTAVDMTDKIETIGEYAFAFCFELEDIPLPEALTHIGEYAFMYCSSVKNIAIPVGMTVIGTGVFDSCSGLTSVTIPEGITEIGETAFLSCSSITELRLPISLTKLGSGAFCQCYKLENIYYPGNSVSWNSVEKTNGWDERCGTNTANGTYTLHLEGGICYYGTCGDNLSWELWADEKTLRITGTGSMTDWSTFAATEWYAHRDLIEKIEIGEGITDIGDFAFNNCTLVSDVAIPHGVTDMGKYAFYGCTSLKTISLPTSLVNIAQGAFGNCGALTAINYAGDKTGWSAVTKGGSWNDGTNATVYYGEDTVYSGTCGDNLTWTLSESSMTLTISGNGSMYDWASSSEVPWYQYRTYIQTVDIQSGVTTVGARAFNGCTMITTVSLPDGLSSVGNYSFSGCNLITAMTLPDSVEAIGSYAFSGCSKLKEINISHGLTSVGNNAFASCTALTAVRVPDTVKTIGDSAFSYCSSLADVSLGTGVEALGQQAFYNCYSLTAIDIPHGVSEIGASTFYKCTKLKTVTLAPGLSSIGAYAFSECSALEEIIIPEGTEGIGNRAFYNCTSLKKVTLPEGLKAIGNNAFYYCKALTDINIPSTLESINSYAFYLCSGIEELTLPEGVKTVGMYAFSDCTALKKLNLPETLTTMSPYAFANCKYLADVYYAGNKASWDSISKNNNWASNAGTATTAKTYTIHYGKKNYYSGSCGDNLTWILHEDEGLLKISGTGAMGESWTGTSHVPWYTYRTLIKTVEMDEGVTSIGKNAFYGCTALTAVAFGEELTTIGDYAFYGCTALRTVTMPKGVISVGSRSFYNCTALTTLTLGEELTTIGDYAFSGCAAVRTVTLPDSLTNIGEYAFYNCKYLASIYYGRSVGEWVTVTKGRSWDAFAGSSTANTIYMLYCEGKVVSTGTMGSSITWIMDTDNKHLVIMGTGIMTEYMSASSYPWYSHKNNIHSVEISEGITTVGRYAFDGYTNLKSVSLPVGIMRINNYAFNGCTSLKEAHLTKSITYLGLSAFGNCTSLAEIYYYGTEEAWELVTKPSSWNTNTNARIIYVPYCLTLTSEAVTVQMAAAQSAILAVAVYDGDTMIDLEIRRITDNAEFSLGSGGLGLTIGSGNTVKAFLLDGDNPIRPLTQEESLEI